MSKDYTRLYISEDVYYKLPEAEQEKFEWVERYRAEDRDDEWCDEVFKDWEDLFNFWGTDHSCYATGSVYEREYKSFTPTDEKEWMKLGQDVCAEKDLEGASCNPIRVKYWDEK